jgi:hypothetical protein
MTASNTSGRTLSIQNMSACQAMAEHNVSSILTNGGGGRSPTKNKSLIEKIKGGSPVDKIKGGTYSDVHQQFKSLTKGGTRPCGATSGRQKPRRRRQEEIEGKQEMAPRLLTLSRFMRSWQELRGQQRGNTKQLRALCRSLE